MLQVYAFWRGYLSRVLCFYGIMHSCSGQISLYGEHPLIQTSAAAAAPTDVDVFQDTFCCHTCAQPVPYIFFSSHALGLDPRYASFRHYPSRLVIPFMDGSDSLVCYFILTSHVHFFYAIPPGETEARPFTSGKLTLRLNLP